MKVYVWYHDNDNSCSDPECCGGPCPSPYVKVFSSIEAAKAAGLSARDIACLNEVTVDNNQEVYVG